MPAKRILVVEDEADIRKLVSYNLTQDGFKVLEAEEGEKALRIVERERPDLIVLSLRSLKERPWIASAVTWPML